MGYSNIQYTINSSTTGVMAGVLTTDGFYFGNLKENLSIMSFRISITDSSSNILCKYTVDPVYVDSSSLLTFSAINETYIRKTEIDDISSEHAHEISEIKGLKDALYSKTSSELTSHTHEISEINGWQDDLDSKTSSESTSISGATVSTSVYTDGYSISVSKGTEYLSFTAGLNEDGDWPQFTFTFSITDDFNFESDKFSSFNVSITNSHGDNMLTISMGYDTKFTYSLGTRSYDVNNYSNDIIDMSKYFEYNIRCKTTIYYPIYITITDQKVIF